MKLVSYLHNGHEQLALLVSDVLYDTDALHPELPSSMNMFLNYWEDCYPLALNCQRAIEDGRISAARGIDASGVDWLAPVPLPLSVRGAAAAGANDLPTGKIPQLRSMDQQLVRGPGELHFMPDHLSGLSATFFIAAVVCRAGRNIPAEEAAPHIGGLIAMACYHTPGFQHGETALALGPSLITPDELESLEIPAREGHVGTSWNLPLSVTVNGNAVGSANLGDAEWTFAELIERASYGRDLFPGDLISAPMDLRTAALHTGDTVEFVLEGYQALTSTIQPDESVFSLLSKGENP